MTVHSETRDGIAVLTLDNPPVNGLGIDTRMALAEALTLAEANPGVRGIVITGAGKLFCGGADIREFDSPVALQEPSLATLVMRLEDSPKPVVMALNGTTLGGGLELSLGAHYRVAASNALIGLPEVKLGLLPGGGGTQRLPRAVGLERALQMIVSGTPVVAAELADTALLDAVAGGDVVTAAVALAQQKAAGPAPWPRVRDRSVDHPDPAAALAAARHHALASAPNYPAPIKCIDALQAAVELPFDAGLAAEREGFMALMATPESRALRHGFFGERAAARIADVGPDIAPRAIRKVGVIGAGTMGGGISMAFLNAGIAVTLVETSQAALERGLATIRGNYEGSARKGKLSAQQVEQRMALLATSLSYEALADADLVIEAVFEDYAVKEAVFRQLDAVVRPGAILASNTSTLDLDRIAGYTQRPQDVVGMHFFSPANVMKLLEVVRGAKTSKEVLATVMALARKLGKTAVVAGVCDGFIGNRMIEQYSRQAGFLLDEGALPQQVDRAMEAYGFAMGPFRMGDLAGNDIGWAIRKRRYVEKPQITYSRTGDLLCELGRYGQKTGKGWYDYRPGDRTAYPSAEVDAMIVQHSADLGLARRDISDREIVERLLYSLANEGAFLLEEGIAAKASDIDIVYLAGYGYPAWRGGPMLHADEVGLAKVLAGMRTYASGYQGDAWQPAPLLQKLASEGGRFNA